MKTPELPLNWLILKRFGVHLCACRKFKANENQRDRADDDPGPITEWKKGKKERRYRVCAPTRAILIMETTAAGRVREDWGKEMSPDASMVVYDFGAALVKKAGRMLLRAAYVRDDNPNVENEVQGFSFAMDSG